MIGRIVEVASDHRHLSLLRGFMVIGDSAKHGAEVGRVALDDISAVMAHAHGLSYSNNLLVALSERGIPFVLCAANHRPVGMLWPLDAHHEQAKRMDAQLHVSLNTRQRLWGALIRQKLDNQAAVLTQFALPSAPLSALAQRVTSGDPENLEAQGAKRYWHLMFGNSFRRDHDAPGTNAMLNYGYTVFRAAMARAVIAAGLHPSIGLHHSNAANAMRLVDDLMEPFRPLLDKAVKHLDDQGEQSLTPQNKRVLVHTLHDDLAYPEGRSPVSVGMERLAQSLAQIALGQRKDLVLPTLTGAAARPPARTRETAR